MNQVIIGSDTYLVETKLKQILDQESNGNDAVDIERLDGLSQPLSLDDVLEAVSTLSLFSPRKIVVVTNPLFVNTTNDEASIKRLQNYYDHNDYAISLIFALINGIDQRKAMVKTIIKNSNVIKLDKLDDIAKSKLVQSYCDHYHIKLKPIIKDALIQRLDNDGLTIAHEMEKLALYGPITSIQEIDDLISHPLETDAFTLSNAIASRDFGKAIQIFRDLVRNGNQPIALIALLATNFRFYYQVLVYRQVEDDDQTIADRLHIKKGRIYYASTVLNHLTVSSCDTVIRLLADLDQSIKQGKIDASFGFEVMLLKLKEAFS